MKLASLLPSYLSVLCLARPVHKVDPTFGAVTLTRYLAIIADYKIVSSLTFTQASSPIVTPEEFFRIPVGGNVPLNFCHGRDRRVKLP